MTKKIMIIDDSRIMRKSLTTIINKESSFEVICTAENGKDALDKLKVLKPDIITLDLEMPIMDGLQTLPYLVKDYNIPVLVVSSLSKKNAEITIKALSTGAADFVTKPSRAASDLDHIEKEIISKLKALSQLEETAIHEKFSFPSQKGTKNEYYPAIDSQSKIVLIGISTGGPSALAQIIPKLSPELNATYLVVQHMPEHFTKAFAERLNNLSDLYIKEAEEGDILRKGGVLIARGNFHLTIKQSKNGLIAKLDAEEKVSGHRPSADKLFYSASKINGPNKMIAAIMTGLGNDGAAGIGAIQSVGGFTIAQDPESCIVSSMPSAAIKKGNVDYVVHLDSIHEQLVTLISE